MCAKYTFSMILLFLFLFTHTHTYFPYVFPVYHRIVSVLFWVLASVITTSPKHKTSLGFPHAVRRQEEDRLKTSSQDLLFACVLMTTCFVVCKTCNELLSFAHTKAFLCLGEFNTFLIISCSNLFASSDLRKPKPLV